MAGLYRDLKTWHVMVMITLTTTTSLNMKAITSQLNQAVIFESKDTILLVLHTLLRLLIMMIFLVEGKIL